MIARPIHDTSDDSELSSESDEEVVDDASVQETSCDDSSDDEDNVLLAQTSGSRKPIWRTYTPDSVSSTCFSWSNIRQSWGEAAN